MGDPHSPGMCIGGCGWMEHLWLETLHADIKENFLATRFMDDILLAIAKSNTWDYQTFLKDFQKSDIYWDPLELKETDPTTFLETRFELKDGKLEHRLKNINEAGPMTAVWRYQHFKSYGGYTTKRATLFSTLTKVHKMASDDTQLLKSALAKLDEFKAVEYPAGIRKFACAIMARDYDSLIWRQVRALQF